MNWLTNVVRPKLRALVGKEVPHNLWHKCTKCEQMIFHRDYEDNWRVCPHCGHHMHLPAERRLDLLFGIGNYSLIPLPKAPLDPLKFKDIKKYTERLKDARHDSNLSDALLIGAGKIGLQPAVVAVLDFRFMGGSMGIAVGNGFLEGARAAIERRCPYIVVTASGGARMQEGILSLMQMARTTVAVNMVREARLPYIVVLADPTAGGVTASFAMLGDIAIAEPRATICFAGRRVIEQTIRHKLPDNFQTAEYLRDHGMIDMVIERQHLARTLEKILHHLTAKI
jgi:acetyl-CoA carboxylase carboxyl transferase subunit beta